MTHTDLSDLSYSFSTRVRGRVYCPGCGVQIVQRTWSVQQSTAMCIRCAERQFFQDEWLAVALRYYVRHADFVQSRGILFWQPVEPLDGIVTHYKTRSRKVNPAGFLGDLDEHGTIPPPPKYGGRPAQNPWRTK